MGLKNSWLKGGLIGVIYVLISTFMIFVVWGYENSTQGILPLLLYNSFLITLIINSLIFFILGIFLLFIFEILNNRNSFIAYTYLGLILSIFIFFSSAFIFIDTNGYFILATSLIIGLAISFLFYFINNKKKSKNN